MSRFHVNPKSGGQLAVVTASFAAVARRQLAHDPPWLPSADDDIAAFSRTDIIRSPTTTSEWVIPFRRSPFVDLGPGRLLYVRVSPGGVLIDFFFFLFLRPSLRPRPGRTISGTSMADLDNFFAKKDRKKTKGQKFATSDNMATSQEELQKKQEKQKKDRVMLQSIHSSENDQVYSKVMIVSRLPRCNPIFTRYSNFYSSSLRFRSFNHLTFCLDPQRCSVIIMQKISYFYFNRPSPPPTMLQIVFTYIDF